jgi:hypothetical protein
MLVVEEDVVDPQPEVTQQETQQATTHELEQLALVAEATAYIKH